MSSGYYELNFSDSLLAAKPSKEFSSGIAFNDSLFGTSRLKIVSVENLFYNTIIFHSKDTFYIKYYNQQRFDLFVDCDSSLKISFFRSDYLTQLEKLPRVHFTSLFLEKNKPIIEKFKVPFCKASLKIEYAYFVSVFLPSILYENGYYPILTKKELKEFTEYIKSPEVNLLDKCN